MVIKKIENQEKEEVFQFCREVFLQTENFFSDDETIKPFLESVDHFTSLMDFIGAYDKELIGVIGYAKDTYALSIFLMKEEKEELKKNLFQAYLEEVKKEDYARVGAIVSPQAKSFYEELGFEQVEEEQEQNGISYITMEYLLQKEYLGKKVHVYIDHPYGSMHPLVGEFCSCNCGYIDEEGMLEGEFQDAYVVGIKEPLERFEGYVVGILYRKNEQQSKWIIAKEPIFHKQEVIQEIAFIEQQYDSRIIGINE